MKRIRYILFPFVLYLLIVVVYVVLDKNSQSRNVKLNVVSKETAKQFSKLLDREGMVQGLSQKEFEEQLNRYTYGQDIRDITFGYHWDGLGAGGYCASGNQYGYELDYRENDINATYTTQFYAKVEPSNFELPCGINFQDSIADIFIKLGAGETVYQRHVVTRQNIGTIILYEDSKYTIELKNNSVLKGVADEVIYDYQLLYTEKYKYTMSNGKIALVTRNIQLSFEHMNSTVSRMDIVIIMQYSIK